MNDPAALLQHLDALTDDGRRALESAIQSNPARRAQLAELTAREASAKRLAWSGQGWEAGAQPPDALKAALLAKVPDWPQTDEEALYLFDWMTRLLPAAVEPRLWDRWLVLLASLEGQRLLEGGQVEYEGMPDPAQERDTLAALQLGGEQAPPPVAWDTLDAAREALALGGPLLAQATAAATQDPRVLRAFCARALAYMAEQGLALRAGQWVPAEPGVAGDGPDALGALMLDPGATAARALWQRHAQDRALNLLLAAIYEDVGAKLGPDGVQHG